MIVDGHCDTIKECYKRNISITDKRLNFNICDAKRPIIQMLATYISPEEENNGFEIAINIIKKFETEKKKYGIKQIYTSKDIEKIGKNDVGIILTTENGSVIDGNLENIDRLYEKGVRMMSIVWNKSNELASGALEKEDKGLTILGNQFVKYLNNKNILIDVSHSSYKTFWDTVKISTKPIVASHSCVYNLCNHPRNLFDDQIKHIAKLNGIIGIAFCNSFLKEDRKANVFDVVKHIKYIVDLVGIDYVGIGSDFDGLENNDILSDLKKTKDIGLLVCALKESGFNDTEINKILGDNWIRIIKENL